METDGDNEPQGFREASAAAAQRWYCPTRAIVPADPFFWSLPKVRCPRLKDRRGALTNPEETDVATYMLAHLLCHSRLFPDSCVCLDSSERNTTFLANSKLRVWKGEPLGSITLVAKLFFFYSLFSVASARISIRFIVEIERELFTKIWGYQNENI